MNILVGVTGSVATIKLHLLIKELRSLNYSVKVVSTKNALKFIDKNVFEETTVYSDDEEWKVIFI